MLSFRFFKVSAAGHVATAPEVLEFPDDASAVRHAVQLVDGLAVEVWEGSRLVVHLTAISDQDEP
jgi:hypothetical protein